MSKVCPNCNAERTAFEKMFLGDYCVRCPSNMAHRELQRIGNMEEENEVLKKKVEDVDELKKCLKELEEENGMLRRRLEDYDGVEKTSEEQDEVDRKLREVTTENEKLQNLVGQLKIDIDALNQENVLDVFKNVLKKNRFRREQNKKTRTTPGAVAMDEVEDFIEKLMFSKLHTAIHQKRFNEDMKAKTWKRVEQEEAVWDELCQNMVNKLDNGALAEKKAKLAQDLAEQMLGTIEEMEDLKAEKQKMIENLTETVKQLTVNATLVKARDDVRIQLLEAKLEDKIEEFEKFKRDQEELMKERGTNEEMEELKAENQKMVDKLAEMTKQLTLHATIETARADAKIQVMEAQLERKNEEINEYRSDVHRIEDRARMKAMVEVQVREIEKDKKHEQKIKAQKNRFDQLQAAFDGLKKDLEKTKNDLVAVENQKNVLIDINKSILSRMREMNKQDA